MENTSYLPSISKSKYRVREIEHKCLKQSGGPSLHPEGHKHPGIAIEADQQYIIISLFKIWEFLLQILKLRFVQFSRVNFVDANVWHDVQVCTCQNGIYRADFMFRHVRCVLLKNTVKRVICVS